MEALQRLQDVESEEHNCMDAKRVKDLQMLPLFLTLNESPSLMVIHLLHFLQTWRNPMATLGQMCMSGT